MRELARGPWRAALLVLAGTLAVAAAAAAAASPGPGSPAQWRTYDLLIDLQDLPRSYSCTDLWYKFRDVLLRIGARHYMLIEPERCQVKGGPAERSPRVHVKLQMPYRLSGAQTRYADTSSAEHVIRLAPGEPASLQGSDCALVEQLRDELLQGLPVRVTAADFHCSAAGGQFVLTVDAQLATGQLAAAGR